MILRPVRLLLKLLIRFVKLFLTTEQLSQQNSAEVYYFQLLIMFYVHVLWREEHAEIDLIINVHI